MTRTSIGIGLMGLGVVGGQVAKVLLEKRDLLSRQVGCPIELKRVKILESDLVRPQARRMDPSLFTTDEEEFFRQPGMDILVEACGGENPAHRYQERALRQGMHVVTPNKEVVAKHGARLLALASENRVALHYEASVGGGIPLIAPFQRDLVANEILTIYAIINGTTNYILTRMASEGMDFPSALKRAQELGYAEADPRNDIEGIDATYKLAILASIGFHCQVQPHNIYCEGVSRLNSRDFQYARELGYAIKLLAIAKQKDGFIEVRVHPVFIPEDALLAKVVGVFNAVQVEGDLVGKVIFYGKGAGALPTSSAVVADIVSAARDIRLGAVSPAGWQVSTDKKIKPMSEVTTRYYFRMNVADRPGVLAQIAHVLGEHQISISQVIQKLVDSTEQTAEIVIMTHHAPEKGVQQAVKELNSLEIVKEINNFIRVETEGLD